VNSPGVLAGAPLAADCTLPLPVAALSRGATPPIRAGRGREGSQVPLRWRSQAQRRRTPPGSSPGRAQARLGEVARAARRATEGASASPPVIRRCVPPSPAGEGPV